MLRTKTKATSKYEVAFFIAKTLAKVREIKKLDNN